MRVLEDSAPFYRALQLQERCRLLGGEPCRANEAAARRRRRWQEVAGLADDAALAQRLEAEGIGLAEFEGALAEAPERLSPARPGWLEVLQATYAEPADCELQSSFLALVAPLAHAGRARVERGAADICRRFAGAEVDAETIVPMLYRDLTTRLTTRVARTAVLEMHVARLEERLAGETPEERFHDFARQLAEPEEALRLLAEYPVLARLAVETVEHWVEATLEFLERLARDAGELAIRYGNGALGRIEELESVAGDLHRGSRSVRLIRFSSGVRLVYKPRSLAVDLHFAELLAWINQRRGELPPLRALRVFDRGDYGWVEFVEHLPCASGSEVERFYLRQGMNLALLHALGACDIHHENLIASGEHPVLIDLESLLAPHVRQRLATSAIEQALAELAGSVLAIGLLPVAADGLDLSGLGSPADQLTPTEVPVWAGAGTDSMRLERRRLLLEEAKNRPALAGARGSAADHARALTSGFAGMYRLIAAHRDELLAAGGPLDRFAGDQVRVIVRPTQVYARLLVESYHPDFLRDALDRDRLLDHLWAGVSHSSAVSRVFRHERTDMWRGDVPLFTTRAWSRDVWASDGSRIDDFFTRSGMELLRERIARFDDSALERQLWYIRAALSLQQSDRHAARGPRGRHRGGGPEATAERLNDAAHAIGDRLAALAVRGGDGDATWTGVLFDDQRAPVVGPLGLDLYSGLPGVTLFLAQLGGDRFTALAEAALATQLEMIDRGAPLGPRVGAFSGRAGMIYLLGRLSRLWGRAELRQRADALVDSLPPLIEQDHELDVIGGTAGCLGVLLGLPASGRAQAVARLCGERLLATARETETGVAWPMPGRPDRMLTGFSHGTAGMAWALLGLWSSTGDQRFRTTAERALAHERHFFRASQGNWMDLRPPEPGEVDKPEAYMTNWCHGAPGIGLARLARLAELDDPVVQSEIEAAIAATVSAPTGLNHSLCHGDLGNLELLIQARRAEPLAQAASSVLESIRRDGWRCGWALSVETPGLMLGLAGIGYGLLRLARPDQVPSVLLLET